MVILLTEAYYVCVFFTIAYREILRMQVYRILSRDFLVAGGQFNLTQTFSRSLALSQSFTQKGHFVALSVTLQNISKTITSEESGKGYEIAVMMVMILMTTEMTIKDKETKSNCFTI
jgi:hypothetical protein